MRLNPKTLFSVVFNVIFLFLAATILPRATLPAVSREAIEILLAFVLLMGLTIGVILLLQSKAFKRS